MQGLAGALRKILNSDWRVYSYKADFATLWSQEDDKFNAWVHGGTGEKHALIVWDGMPEADEQPINILDHLTPFDWALSLSRDLLDKHLHNRQKEQPAALPALRILILDLYSHHHYDAFACRMLESILPAMPWMKVFRLLPRLADSQSAVDKNGVEEFRKVIVELSSNAATPFSPLNKDPGAAFAAVRPFVDAWTGNLLQSGSHHDVNNLLGPLLLSEAFNDPALQGRVLTSRLPRRALLQHARWLGLAPDKEKVGEAAGGRWFDIASSANELGDNIVVTLLDDQANNGWVDILTGALGMQRKINGDEPIPASENGFSQVAEKVRVTISASTSCEAILKSLGDLFNKAAGRCDYRFELGFAGNAGEQEKAEILLWDLRLSWDRDKEIDYFQRALTLARNLAQAHKDKPWPWVALDAELIGDGTEAKPGLLGPWLEEAKAGSHGQDWRKEKTYLECLTLLPRIIATMDLSLPIVIFSSSGQRQITESVKGFGNIITAFEKPRFSGYLSDDVVIETKAKLCTAFEQAMKLLTARRLMRELRKLSLNRQETQAPEQYSHVELYVDESFRDGDTTIIVGGPYAIFSGKSLEEAQKHADAFDDVLVSEGVQFFDNCGLGVQLTTGQQIKRKGTAVHAHVNRAITNSHASVKPQTMGSVRMRLQLNNPSVSARDDLEAADRLYWGALSALLEIFLYDVIPSVVRGNAGRERVSIGVYIGTRIKPYESRPNETDAPNTYWKDQYRFGLQHALTGKPDTTGITKYFLRTISEDSLYPVLAAILSFRGQPFTLDRVLARRFVYEFPEGDQPPKLPEVFACRTCLRPLKKVSVSVGPDDLHKFEGLGKIGPLLFLPNGKPKSYRYIEMLTEEGVKDVFCHRDNWPGIIGAAAGDVVTGLTITQDLHERWRVTKRVGTPPANDGEKDVFCQALVWYSSRDAHKRQIADLTCTCGEKLVPDYRALHYVADDLLRPHKRYESLMMNKNNIWFADNLDEPLQKLMVASHLYDSGRYDEALIQVGQSWDSRNPLLQEGSASRIILRRLSDAPIKLDGKGFLKAVASIPERHTCQSVTKVVGCDRSPVEDVAPESQSQQRDQVVTVSEAQGHAPLSQGVSKNTYYIVLSGFGEDVTEQNVLDRVSDYLIRVGMKYYKSLKAGRSDRGDLQCELYGLSARQCKQVEGLLEEPPAAGMPPWKNCNVMAPPRAG